MAQCQMELASFKELSTLQVNKQPFESWSTLVVPPFKQDSIRSSLEDQLQTGQQGPLESLKLKEAQRKLQAQDSALAIAQEEKQGLLHRLSACSMVPVDVMIASIH